MVANDVLVEPDETALIDANIADPEILSDPAVVTVLDDDGPGDPASRPRSERGLILLLGAGKQGDEIFFSEPDATELTPVSLGTRPAVTTASAARGRPTGVGFCFSTSLRRRPRGSRSLASA